MTPFLPPFPALRLELVDDTTARSRCDEGFVRLRRRTLRLVFPDGQTSEPFAYDEAYREACGAVVVVPWSRAPQGEARVSLRSALRPPVALREARVEPAGAPPPPSQLWEICAGLVEPDERGEGGLVRCAARELGEEL